MADSLLPITATPLARALDSLEVRLFDLPAQMITKDPATVDVKLLDHLAWENSCDSWDSEWPENIKRAVIIAATEVHRFKGTPFAVKRALEALNVRTELVEWWQTEPEGTPGTFTVAAYAGESLSSGSEILIDEVLAGALVFVIRAAAPVSRTFEMVLGAKLSMPRAGVTGNVTGLHWTRSRMVVTQKAAPLRMTLHTAQTTKTIGLVRARMA